MRGQLENVIDRLNVINKRHNRITNDITNSQRASIQNSAKSSMTQIKGATEKRVR